MTRRRSHPWHRWNAARASMLPVTDDPVFGSSVQSNRGRGLAVGRGSTLSTTHIYIFVCGLSLLIFSSLFSCHCCVSSASWSFMSQKRTAHRAVARRKRPKTYSGLRLGCTRSESHYVAKFGRNLKQGSIARAPEPCKGAPTSAQGETLG